MAESFLSTSTTIRLPNIHTPFPLVYHKNGDAIAAASDHWFENGCRSFTEDKRRRLYGLKAGQLTAYCYHNTDDHRLRVVCDFMNFLFHLDDISDDLKATETVALSDVVMNAFASPHSYRGILPDGRRLPEEEPEASKLARECVLLYFYYLGSFRLIEKFYIATGADAFEMQALEFKHDIAEVWRNSLKLS
jgi:alpha-muurolene/germacrene-A/gamma-muurolene/(+)-delta-cadinol synthase